MDNNWSDLYFIATVLNNSLCRENIENEEKGGNEEKVTPPGFGNTIQQQTC